MANSLSVERGQTVVGVVPVDLSGGANDGDWVSLKNFNRIAIKFVKGAGTAGDDPTLTIEQATDVSGTGAKALTFTKIYVKQGTQTGIGTFTEISQTAANTYTEATSAEAQAIWVVEFRAQDLDVDNGFDCVRARVADVGTNAQIGCVLYELFDAATEAKPADMPSAIID